LINYVNDANLLCQMPIIRYFYGNKHYHMRRILSLFALSLGLYSGIFACGYDFISSCGNAVHFKINGTTDSFYLSPCPSGKQLSGLHLGALRSLELVDATCITWESCQNNVTSARLFYRIFPMNTNMGAWQNQLLFQEYDIQQGPYTTRYRRAGVNFDLTTGLQVGQSYIFECYIQVEVDTQGDDFIPETTLTQTNNGAPFRLEFSFAGPTGPPFSIVETRHQDNLCFGGNAGLVGVSVYGEQNGLFYTWSNQPLNFHTQNNLSVGNYTVTVSISSGYTQTLQTEVLQPETPIQLSLQTSGIPQADCSGVVPVPFTLLIDALSDTSPLLYTWWLNGQQVSNTSVLEIVMDSLNMALPVLQVMDSLGCTAVANPTLSIPSYLPLQLDQSAQAASGPNQPDGAVMTNIEGGLEPYTFYWSNDSTTQILMNVPPGVYCLTVTDARNCSATKCTFVDYVLTADQAAQLPEIQVFPNLINAGERLTLRTDTPLSENNLTFFDTKGVFHRLKMVKQTEGEYHATLPTGLISGTYWIRCVTSKGPVFAQMMVM
jgi:hypothetical protein